MCLICQLINTDLRKSGKGKGREIISVLWFMTQKVCEVETLHFGSNAGVSTFYHNNTEFHPATPKQAWARLMAIAFFSGKPLNKVLIKV